MTKLVALGLIVGLALTCGVPSVALAHGYVERFSPPLPLAWYLTAAGAAVVLSFLVSHLMTRSPTGTVAVPASFIKLGPFATHPGWSRFAAVGCRSMVLASQVVSVVLFTIVVVAGFVGDQSPIHNIAPTFVWVIFWIGVPIVCATLGNIWRLLNPWDLLFRVAEYTCTRGFGLRRISPPAGYRAAWDVWPAAFLFLAFAWVENIYPDSIDPFRLSTMVTIYSVITWTGMFIFGREVWLRHGDPFSVLFGLLARCSFIEPTVSTDANCQGCPEQCLAQNQSCRDCPTCFVKSPWTTRVLNLRMFGSGVIRHHDTSTAVTVFVLLVLSTMTLDGFLATTTWGDLRALLVNVLPNLTLVGSIALLAAPTIFYFVYQLFMTLSSFMGSTPLSGYSLGRIFAITLLPIAVAYHIAHFHYFLLVQGQAIIPLISDPLGFGWNLFGTTAYRIDVTILSAHASWLFTVVLIVVGHIVAVYAAHAIAVRHFGTKASLIRGQTAVLLLMTGYTILSLWVMGQPMLN